MKLNGFRMDLSSSLNDCCTAVEKLFAASPVTLKEMMVVWMIEASSSVDCATVADAAIITRRTIELMALVLVTITDLQCSLHKTQSNY